MRIQGEVPHLRQVLDIVSVLILNFPASRTVGNASLLFEILPVSVKLTDKD